jgi:hypothetical protein
MASLSTARARSAAFGTVLAGFALVSACEGSSTGPSDHDPVPSVDGSTTSGGDGAASSDGAAPDGTAQDGAPADAAASACFAADGKVLATLKRCTGDGDCVVRMRVPCCGPTYGVGINASFADAFAACEGPLEAACAPGRGCSSGPLFAEDGRSGELRNILLKCDAGACRTSFAP